MCSSLNGAVVWSVSLSLKCVMFAKQVSQQKTLPVYQPRLIQQLCLLFLWQEKSLPFNPPSLSHLLSCFSSLTLSHEFVSLGGKSVRLLQPWALSLIPAVTTCTANAHPPTLHQQTRGMIYYNKAENTCWSAQYEVNESNRSWDESFLTFQIAISCVKSVEWTVLRLHIHHHVFLTHCFSRTHTHAPTQS